MQPWMKYTLIGVGVIILLIILYFVVSKPASTQTPPIDGNNNPLPPDTTGTGGNTGGGGGTSAGGTQVLVHYPCETKKVCKSRPGYANWVKSGNRKQCNCSNICQKLCLNDCNGTCEVWEDKA